MKISIERTGGFAGIPFLAAVDTTNLNPTTAAALQQAIAGVNFFALPATLPPTNQPDRFQYQITVEEGTRSHTVTVGETSLSPELRSIVEQVMSLGRS